MIRCKSGHPNEDGYPYTRSQTLRECSRRGRALLEELGWPTDPKAVYWNIYCFEPESLETICEPWNDDDFKRRMSEDEHELNRITEGHLENRGLECTDVKFWKSLIIKYPVRNKLREAVRLNKGFYERLHRDLYGDAPISKIAKGDSICEINIMRLAKWLGLNVDRRELDESLPPINIYAGVWAVIEHYQPEKPTVEEKVKTKTERARGQFTMDIYIESK